MFDFPCSGGGSPQMFELFRFHTLGTGKLSRRCPQGTLLRDHQARSAGCGFVDDDSPQAVDEFFVHRVCMTLSTAGPQAQACCPQLSVASPHGRPLFGNATRPLTGSSERRHTKVRGWPVGKVGKAGDSAGEK